MGVTCGLIAVLVVYVLGTSTARPDCGAYEDAERTTYRQVSWTDFDGPRPPKWQGRMRDVVEKAHIATSLKLEPMEIEVWAEGPRQWAARPQRFCVRAFMLKDRSGYKREERSLRGLAHEQGHFDITEYFARELRRRVIGLEYRAGSQALARGGLWKAVKREYAEVATGWRATQARYDRETRHNQIRVAQNRWLEKIEDLLTQ